MYILWHESGAKGIDMSCTSRRQTGAKKCRTCRPMAFCVPGDLPFSLPFPKFMNAVSLDINLLHSFAFWIIRRFAGCKFTENKWNTNIMTRRTRGEQAKGQKMHESAKLKPDRLEVLVLPWHHYTAHYCTNLHNVLWTSVVAQQRT